MSLYLKYRPQDFSTVVGQEPIIKTLQNALKRGAINHAYLFAGPRGTGKTSLARILAKAINCPKAKNAEPCNACDICESIGKGRLVDLIEIDAASNRGIDEIRELRDKIQFSPTHARAKVYIIDEVHMLTKEAFNALLKTLEEPPEHAYFILATTEAHKIPETIVSRCQHFTFRRISPEDIRVRLEKIAEAEKVKADPEALSLIAKMANGGLRDAIGMLEQMNIDGQIKYEEAAARLGLSGAMLVESFFQALMDRDIPKALETINQVSAQGKNLHQFASEVIELLRGQMLLSVDNHKELPFILEVLAVFSEAKALINQSLIPQLPLEMAVIKICAKETDLPRAKEETKEKAAAAVEKEQTPTFTPPAASEKNMEKTPLDLKTIRENWKRVAQAIVTPFIRVSFMDGEAVQYEGGELHLEFKSSSLMEKIQNKANQAQVQSAFEDIFSQKIRLNISLKQVNLKPASAAEEKPQPSVAEMAEEVFGK